MRTLLLLSLAVIFFGVSPAQNYEKEYREFEATYTRGLLYSVHLKYWPHSFNRVAWKGVQKPLLHGFTAKNEAIEYAAFSNALLDHCVIVVIKSWLHPRDTIKEHFPDYIVTPVPNDEATVDDRYIYHLKRTLGHRSENYKLKIYGISQAADSLNAPRDEALDKILRRSK